MPDGKQLNQLYYGSGHLYNQSITDTKGQVTEIRHSQRNELHQEVKRLSGHLEREFDYDSMGRLVKQGAYVVIHIIAFNVSLLGFVCLSNKLIVLVVLIVTGKAVKTSFANQIVGFVVLIAKTVSYAVDSLGGSMLTMKAKAICCK